MNSQFSIKDGKVHDKPSKEGLQAMQERAKNNPHSMQNVKGKGKGKGEEREKGREQEREKD